MLHIPSELGATPVDLIDRPQSGICKLLSEPLVLVPLFKSAANPIKTSILELEAGFSKWVLPDYMKRSSGVAAR